MMITCLDIETTYQKDDAYSYNGKNQLVCVGFKTHTGKEDYLWFYHKEREPTNNAKQILQDLLHNTKILIGHNIKFDLGWLYCCGFTYNNAVYDTMVVEYLLSRGVKRPISLEESCKRRKVKQKKKYLVQNFMKNGTSMEDIPARLVEEYGMGDVSCTYELAQEQCRILEVELNEFSKYN